MSEKVLVGMSGGVDSSTSAALLLEKGYSVTGFTFKFFDDDRAEKTIEEAGKVSKSLGIDHIVIDETGEFKSNVMDYFVDSYIKGETPNPCVLCNRKLKFGKSIEYALENGYDKVATGHYAIIDFSEKHHQYVLKKGWDTKKDQSYFLYNINKNYFKHILFPLGEYTKENIRKMAKDRNIITASKPDSQEVCFIDNNDYKSFIKDKYNIKGVKGKFIDLEGNVLGRHEGIVNYTIGQRKGLGIAFGKPMYVVAINPELNTVTLGSNDDLFKNELIAEQLNMLIPGYKKTISCLAKIRYRAEFTKAVVELREGKAYVTFEEPQRAITKGQSVVFYEENIVIGGGIIV